MNPSSNPSASGPPTLDPLKSALSRSPSRSKMGAWADRVGICLSGLCLLHCLATPIVFLILPSLTLFELHHDLHGVLMVVLPLVALAAFVPGYRRHRQVSVWGWAIAGIAAIVAATLFFEATWGERALTVAGSVFLIRAHWLNREFCACCAAGHDPAKRRRVRMPFKARQTRGPLQIERLRSFEEPTPPKKKSFRSN